MEKEVTLRQLSCSHCQAIFFVCVRHYRGHEYCSSTCRTTRQRQLHRMANQRYQQSEEGRLDHRDRQREYRKRQLLRGASVTDEGSELANNSGSSEEQRDLEQPMADSSDIQERSANDAFAHPGNLNTPGTDRSFTYLGIGQPTEVQPSSSQGYPLSALDDYLSRRSSSPAETTPPRCLVCGEKGRFFLPWTH